MGGAPTPIEIYSHIKAKQSQQSEEKTSKSVSSVSDFSSLLQVKGKPQMTESTINSRE